MKGENFKVQVQKMQKQYNKTSAHCTLKENR